MEDQGLRGRGSRIHSAFLPQSFRPRHLRAAWQIHSKHSPDVHAWLWLWRAALSSSSALRAGAEKQGHRNAAGPVLMVPAKEGQTAQERAMRPGQLDSIQGLRSSRQRWPRSIPGVRSPWAELLLPRKKKPRTEEKVKGPNPHLQPPHSMSVLLPVTSTLLGLAECGGEAPQTLLSMTPYLSRVVSKQYLRHSGQALRNQNLFHEEK